MREGGSLHPKIQISVIVPIHRRTKHLQRLRGFIVTNHSKCELILVINNPALKDDIVTQYPREIVITEPQSGRGFALKRGAEIAHGDIILFLHADSILPQNWDKAIIKQLQQPNTVGGGFALKFDTSTIFLEYLVKFSTILFRLTGELWGDRAIFVRSKILRKCLSALNVPLFEDIRLSKCMRKQGTVILLDKHVTTSAASFQQFGHLPHTIRILLSRLWFAFGGDPKRIYNYYYRTH